MSDLFDSVLDEYNLGYLIKGLEPTKQRVVLGLIDGGNFNSVGKDLNLKTSQVYKIKEELKVEFEWLRTQYYGTDRSTFEDQLFDMMREGVSKMSLSHFVELYLSDYSKVDYSDILKWENNQDYKDRTLVAICIIIRELFIRTKPIVIDYYHNNREKLVTFVQRFKEVVKTSPIIKDRIEILRTDADLIIKLQDNSQIRTIWTKGRKPSTAGTISILDEITPETEKITPRISYIA